MCNGSANNRKILHKRSMRILYSDKLPSFEILLENNGSVSISNRNLQILATGMYKIKNVLYSLIVTEPFEQRNEQHYDLRNNAQFTIFPIRLFGDRDAIL